MKNISLLKRFSCSGASAANLAATCIRADKQMRAKISEKQIDKTLKDSFPASDPPGGY